MESDRILLAYLPVLHRGYLDFFSRFGRDITLAVLGEWFMDIEELSYFKKDVRRLTAPEAAMLAEALGYFGKVLVVESEEEFLNLDPLVLHMPQDHVSGALERRYSRWFASRHVEHWPVFLMWDKANTKTQYEVEPDRTVPLHSEEGLWMHEVGAFEKRSGDWWRRVGAVAVRDGKMLMGAHNEHFPNEHAAYEDGDPRFASHRGQDLDLTAAGHAEALIIARAAREGICLKDAHLYVGTFSCPTCAIGIGEAGFSRLYYRGGYSLVTAGPILKSRNVEIIRVEA